MKGAMKGSMKKAAMKGAMTMKKTVKSMKAVKVAMKEQKTMNVKASKSVTAEALLAAGVDAVIVSAGSDVAQLEGLIQMSTKLNTAAAGQLQQVRRKCDVCQQADCGKRAAQHCSGCHEAVCDDCLDDQCGKCVECDAPCCEDCGLRCDFDDM